MDSELEQISESFLFKDDGKEIESNVLEAKDELLAQKKRSDEKILCKEPQTQAAEEEVISVKVEDDDEGFKTPTCQEHKVEAIKLQCPPAPRKPKSLRSPANKRKSFDANSIVRRVINLSDDDVESLFPSDHHFHHTNVKKPRTA